MSGRTKEEREAILNGEVCMTARRQASECSEQGLDRKTKNT